MSDTDIITETTVCGKHGRTHACFEKQKKYVVSLKKNKLETIIFSEAVHRHIELLSKAWKDRTLAVTNIMLLWVRSWMHHFMLPQAFAFLIHCQSTTNLLWGENQGFWFTLVKVIIILLFQGLNSVPYCKPYLQQTWNSCCKPAP